MANTWFRFYSEFSHDPKVQMMTEAMQRRLVMLFCDKCSDVLVTLSEQELAFRWRISDEELGKTKSVFIDKGFIDDGWNILNWNRRQFISDSSTERTRRYRERKRTSHKSHSDGDETKSDALDTDTDTDTEQIQNREELTLLSSESTSDHLAVFPETWNRLSGFLPKVEKFTSSRRKKLASRVHEGLTLSRFIEAIKWCTVKPHLRGDNDRGWTATFDWLIENDKNLEKAMTNSYGLVPGENNGKRNRNTPTTEHNSNALQEAVQLAGLKEGPAIGSGSTSDDSSTDENRRSIIAHMGRQPGTIFPRTIDASLHEGGDGDQGMAVRGANR